MGEKPDRYFDRLWYTLPIMKKVLVHKVFSRYWFDFVAAMTEKEIKARYKHAVLGFLWVFLNPLFQMLVIGFVFQFFVPHQKENYFLFLFAGLLPWNFFSYSFTKSTQAFIFERQLIQKAKFPREAIVISIILSNFFHLIISSGIFLAVLALISIISNDLGGLFHSLQFWPLLIVSYVWLFILTVGVSLLFSSLNVKYRDMNFIVQAIVPLWFYATPIVYSLEVLPEKIRYWAYLNPLTGITESFQFAFLGSTPLSWQWWSVSFVTSVLLAILGIGVFVKEAPFFDDWL
jgi:lipopolysaccharide transport system permease protein